MGMAIFLHESNREMNQPFLKFEPTLINLLTNQVYLLINVLNFHLEIRC